MAKVVSEFSIAWHHRRSFVKPVNAPMTHRRTTGLATRRTLSNCWRSRLSRSSRQQCTTSHLPSGSGSPRLLSNWRFQQQTSRRRSTRCQPLIRGLHKSSLTDFSSCLLSL
ncbi:hypothetical protein RF11_08698 [Thelohanellus kitauei]|uniref:Uncharacterized protein n=1 Tax=Thelohanellus kitauei TaxID=669202 RepID=A0A0C2N3X3_THEKT|nr:hypothetical protein RF11_08698 [Thelohanellus kitauei]